jgi:UDP-galactopyranose mutase
LIVGGGLTAAAAAVALVEEIEVEVHVHESGPRVGGALATSNLHGVLFEEQGAHISHTNNETAIKFLRRFANWIPYIHRVTSETPKGLLSWPVQVSELKDLNEWPIIERELQNRPKIPDTSNFERYVIDLMGQTLYGWFVYGYTRKQWGRDPAELSSSFAPKRVEIRSDGYLPLFRESFQGWPQGGWERLVEKALSHSARIRIDLNTWESAESVDWGNWDAVLVTAPLDEFLGLSPFEWRGVRLEHEFIAGVSGTLLPSGVVNYPGLEVGFTRIIETKWMSGQANELFGTVLSKEYPGHTAKHYPVDDVQGINRRLANEAKHKLKTEHPTSFIAGRLANYVYIDTDQAIIQGINAARQISAFLGESRGTQ